ncbi:MAG: DUF2961 domain-containing protein [Oscillospiraceae bacterium]|nr:DUF2961 domain-containing protein [Oscillospiraceae bacterium]
MKDLYSMKNAQNIHTRWASFENPSAGKGSAGSENNTAKGRAFERLPAGITVNLLNYDGAGTVTRIWITVSDRSPNMLRSLVLRCYWDDAEKPAVEAPLGDFFSCGSRLCKFESELFSSPEGRSFNSYAPMPFKKSAKITVTNESETDLSHIFYDVNMLVSDESDPDALYFHCYWNRVKSTIPGKDYVILPEINGTGRLLGASFEVNANPIYGHHWWGEGEVKVYIDDDADLPTLCGTGTEDYIGTGWGQGAFYNRYQGCPVSDGEKRQWIFYRLHIADPIYFKSGVKYTIQIIGGGNAGEVKEMLEKNIPLIPVSCDENGAEFMRLYKTVKPLPENGWVNYYRSDDFASTVWFYLNSNENQLPKLQSVGERI